MTGIPDRLTRALADRYRIERELGAGGMATVYLAHDVRHDRKVAIKVLKPELAAVLGAERFVVEIKTTAALSHPHILPLFDSGTADGFLYYVMPYIQGETIREKLNRETQFGVEEAVRIAREVADALDYAHRHGVIHRDIKPENILLHDGRAMVMDFGIALAVSAAAGGRMTETGLSLGTPHYMSPEQATAEKDISARSDQYSLASVLYEMLAGDPPFTASAAQAVIMKIITEQAPSVTDRRKNVPAHVGAALAKALEKLPADRFESAKAFADALGNPGFAASATSPAARAAAVAARASRRALVGVSAVALIAIAGWIRAATGSSPAVNAPVIRVPLDLPAGERLAYRAGALAISPDGQRIAYVTIGPRGARTVVRRTDEFVGREIAATGLRNLAFSPDGNWVAYSDGTQIRKIPADGGASTVVGAVTGGAVRGMAWSPLDTIVVGTVGGLWTIPAAGGTARRIVPADSLATYSYPIFLDDGRTVVFSYRRVFSSSLLATVAPGAGVPVLGKLEMKAPLGLWDGRLVYASEDGALFAVRFNTPTATPSGDPVQVDDSILVYPLAGGTTAALSSSGTLAYVRGLGATQLVVAAANRPDLPLELDLGQMTAPRYSPDGRKVLFGRYDPVPRKTDAFIHDLRARTTTRVNDATMRALYPEWSPDGKRVIFRRSDIDGQRSKELGIWWQAPDGGGRPELLYAPSENYVEAVIAPDARSLVYRSCPSFRICSLVAVSLGEGGKRTTLVPAADGVSHPRISPDGKWIAYHSSESGTGEVYVRPYPMGGPRVQISDKGGTEPQWARSGRAITYRSANTLMSATLSSGATLAVAERRPVLTGEYLFGNTPNYDIAPDGNSFLMLKSAFGGARPVVIHNWGSELRKKLAGKE